MKQPERPIDKKDMHWSYLGKDALDAAAERAWEVMRNYGLVWNCVDDKEMEPYHVLPTREQHAVQKVVLALFGTDVPTLLRRRANEIYSDRKHEKPELWPLEDLADELEEHHG